MSGKVGWCSAIAQMQCISEFPIGEAISIDASWCGLQALVLGLPVFSLLRMVRLVVIVVDVRISPFGFGFVVAMGT